MGSSSPLRSSVSSLTQRFAYKPSEAVRTSPTSANKRRKLDGASAQVASLSTTATTTLESTGDGQEVAVASASKLTVVETRDAEPADASGKRKQPAPVAASSIEELQDRVARTFEESLSNKAYEGAGGSLSERQLLRLECETLHPSWLEALSRELKKEYFLKLKRFLWSEGVKSSQLASKTIFPPAKDIYSWSRYTPLPDVRVVILGQDPYHNDGQAHGLCFSVRSNVKVPPSLKNIYKEIKTDYPEFVTPPHGYLASWAKQGVLLLNTCLTVRAHQANSHSKKGWEEFTDNVLKVIDARPGPGVVFLAWGLPAQKRMQGINKEKHLVLASAHPSPLSARTGFHGNAHFKRANEWLKEKYGEQAGIDWCRLEAEAAPGTSSEGAC